MPLVKINAAGTTSSTFRIGKSGPTIFQGASTPSNTDGANGDLYIRTGSAARIFQKRSGTWSVPEPTAFSREEVVAGQTVSISSLTTYVAIINAITVDSTAIRVDSTAETVDMDSGDTALSLPAGVEGMQITVKDEGGVATANPVTVIADDTIDGAESYVLDTAFAAVTFVYTGGAWWLV